MQKGVGPPGRASATSPSSSSQSGFDKIQQQGRQSAQPQQKQVTDREPEGNDGFSGYQGGGSQGVMGMESFEFPSGSLSQPQQPRINQQHGSPSMQDEAQNRNQCVEGHNMMHPFHCVNQANQQKSAIEMQLRQAKTTVVGIPSGKDQRLVDQVNLPTHGQRSGPLHSSGSAASGQLMHRNMSRPSQFPEGLESMLNNPAAVALQMQAMHVWAREHNVDVTKHPNANVMAQLLQVIQSRTLAQQNANEINSGSQSSPNSTSIRQVASPSVMSEHSHGNTSKHLSGQDNSGEPRHATLYNSFGEDPGSILNTTNKIMQQVNVRTSETQLHRQPSVVSGNETLSMQPHQSSLKTGHGGAESLQQKSLQSGPDTQQTQYLSSSNGTGSCTDGRSGIVLPAVKVENPAGQQFFGFTKQQRHVLKAQILAFRRLKKGESKLPQVVFRAIAPPPLEIQLQEIFSGTSNQVRAVQNNVKDFQDDNTSRERDTRTGSLLMGPNNSREALDMQEKDSSFVANISHSAPTSQNEALVLVGEGKSEQETVPVRVEPEVVGGKHKLLMEDNLTVERRKDIGEQVATPDLVNTPAHGITTLLVKNVNSGKYHGPLFDFPFFTRKHDSAESTLAANSNNNLLLAYELKGILHNESVQVLSQRRMENSKKIGDLLTINLERERIRPDLVLRLQIEEKKLRLAEFQARLRDKVDVEQQDIMAMPDRPYKKFVRLCERQRMELTKQVQSLQKASRVKQLKLVFQWRKRLLEAYWAVRDARTARNRGIAKYHEKMLREFSKTKDDDRNKRMEALKNNDLERYRQILMEQQSSIPGEAAERYAVLSSFLSQTEEYLQKLGSKITAAKNQQEGNEAANAASAAAGAQGLSEEEVRAAAACAREEVIIRNQFSEINAPRGNSSVNKYYSLAHAVNERVTRQPSMLRAGTLRDYQLVGLQWMLSLYNNKLNGILADEMGLGKTVQVMALIAHLMEFKGNNGPHLIIVPNAVLVNWKSEFHHWLPSVSCIFYVGTKDQRAKLFSQGVCAMKFNVLVTTYEFIMYDRSKLSKVDWKYIIIDEAQRMKDRESVLARDLDRYRCQRRLLLTGTPLQNDLKELWSLLNLLLPEVFDNRKVFHDWFSKPFQKDAPLYNAEDDWLEMEKKVIIIHRLHQILEPFMLRRRVEDVEGSLPPKVSIVLRCKMSAMQTAIYDWIKTTGTLRVDPEDEQRRVQKNPVYQVKAYKTLNNKCMELRKTCNHPLLNYPYFNDLSKGFLVESCGKLWMLDRILIKLHRTGHRVLLFSTMTKLLDILDEYLQWRKLIYRRIDGTTSLEDRESAIVDFNSPGSDCFIFLLSIRAAGRGLNLQTADTVVIYDPDPNPKNEEQAVARAHRIGQKREVKVIYMEAVVDKVSGQQNQDKYHNQGKIDSEDDLEGKDRYIGSIESLIRSNIQQYKIEMADEVINAGRFDQRTTHEERRMTLEAMLHDEERYQETVHDVPSLHQVNCMIARSKEEVELFDNMDEELDWVDEMIKYEQVPKWIRASSKEISATVSKLTKKPARSAVFAGNILESDGMGSESPSRNGSRGRPKRKKIPNYSAFDDEEHGQYSDASSDERDVDSHEEEAEVEDEFEDEDTDRTAVTNLPNMYNGDDGPAGNINIKHLKASERDLTTSLVTACSSGSSSDNQRRIQMISPSIPSQKFGSLSTFDAKQRSSSKKITADFEEGENSASGESLMDLQHSGSWNRDRDGENEKGLQPIIKRKRSFRGRPRQLVDKHEGKMIPNRLSVRRGDTAHLPFQVESNCDLPSTPYYASKATVNNTKPGFAESSSKQRQSLSLRRNRSKLPTPPKSSRSNGVSSSAEDAEHSPDSFALKASSSRELGPRMSDAIQRRCKNVMSKLQRRIDGEGLQIVPLLIALWKKIERLGYMNVSGNVLSDLRTIDQCIDRFEYSSVMELISSVQNMLKGAIQYYRYSLEVRTEARKVHKLFFDILKIALPDMDFRKALNDISFSAAPDDASTSTGSARLLLKSQTEQHKLVNEVKYSRKRSQTLSKEPSVVGKQGEPGLLLHPAEFLICKKKRKEREKTLTGPTAPPSLRYPNIGSSRDTRSAQQSAQLSIGSAQAGWANPVKRMRTDTGKRRPSHL